MKSAPIRTVSGGRLSAWISIRRIAAGKSP